MREGRNPSLRDDISKSRRIAGVRFEQFRANLVSNLRDIRLRLQLGHFKHQLPRERVSVGVQTYGGQCQQGVSRLHRLAGQKPLAFDGAYNESGQIVFSRRIEARHLRRLAADQRATRFAARAAHSVHQLLHDVWLQLPHGQVIQKKQRLGPLHKNVVHAVIHQVAADGRMYPHRRGYFQLCPHAVGARHQHRFLPLPPIQSKQSAESADPAKHRGSKCSARKVPDSLLRFVSDSYVYSSVGVFHRLLPRWLAS